MSARGRKGAPATTPALVNNATPEGAAPPAGGVMSAETPSEPAVPSTEPLPSDQATAAERPAVAAGEDVLRPDLSDAPVDRPSIVPETPPAADLVAPAAGEPAGTDVVMAHVPGTVPLPADLVTPAAPVSRADAFAAFLGDLTETEIEQLRARLGVSALGTDQHYSGYVAFDDRAGADDIRLFPVLYHVDLNGISYEPGGDPIPLTIEEHRRLVGATAVNVDWLAGRLLEDGDA